VAEREVVQPVELEYPLRVWLLTQTAQQLESVLQERVQLDGFVEGLDSFRLPLRLHVHLAQ